jgi:hypothetical protein
MQVAGPSPGMPAGVALDPQAGKPLSVPLVSGTPRYLLFRSELGDICDPMPAVSMPYHQLFSLLHSCSLALVVLHRMAQRCVCFPLCISPYSIHFC